MAATPRRHHKDIPMFTRASDLNVECWAQWFLSHYFVDELPDAGFFILGAAAHDAIEQAILKDLDVDTTVRIAHDQAYHAMQQAENSGRGIIWSKKRNQDNIDETLALVITNWFLDVHPDAQDRNPVYNLYKWPPRVEFPIELPDVMNYGLYTRPDAIFEHKSGKFHAVVDWKTGATAKSNDIQLWTYRYGLRKLGINVERGWFHHLAFRKLQDIEDWLTDQYVSMRIREAEVIKENRLFTPRPDWYCDYCRARELCPLVGGGMGWGDMMGCVEDSRPMYKAISETDVVEPKV